MNPMTQILNSSRWFELRDRNMASARSNMIVLIDPNGRYRYNRNDPRVAAANRFWVNRARFCHAIAIGRECLAKAFLLQSEMNCVAGALRAG